MVVVYSYGGGRRGDRDIYSHLHVAGVLSYTDSCRSKNASFFPVIRKGVSSSVDMISIGRLIELSGFDKPRTKSGGVKVLFVAVFDGSWIGIYRFAVGCAVKCFPVLAATYNVFVNAVKADKEKLLGFMRWVAEDVFDSEFIGERIDKNICVIGAFSEPVYRTKKYHIYEAKSFPRTSIDYRGDLVEFLRRNGYLRTGGRTHKQENIDY